MPISVVINPAVPPDSETPQAGALRIRNLTLAIATLFGLPTAPTVITEPLFSTTADGKVTILQSALGTLLTNKTGVVLVAGDVVAYDATNDSAVALADFSGALVQFAVALQTIAVNAQGTFATSGVVTALNVTGAVTRTDYLRKSATTKVAEDTGIIAATATPAPAGAFALALSAAAGPGLGQIAAYLFGTTFASASVSGARAYRSTNQNIPTGVDTAIVFDNTRYNVGSVWAIGQPTRLTSPVTGRYLLGGSLQWVNTITARISVRVNGTTVIAKSRSDDQAGDINTVFQLAASDYVELIARQGTGGPQAVSSSADSSPEFYMQLLST